MGKNIIAVSLVIFCQVACKTTKGPRPPQFTEKLSNATVPDIRLDEKRFVGNDRTRISDCFKHQVCNEGVRKRIADAICRHAKADRSKAHASASFRTVTLNTDPRGDSVDINIGLWICTINTENPDYEICSWTYDRSPSASSSFFQVIECEDDPEKEPSAS